MRFDMICEADGIENRLPKPNHPWPNGRVKRKNRTIKNAAAKHFHYDGHDHLRIHPRNFMAAYNSARWLKTLGGPTPYEYICKIWTWKPDQFILDPIGQMPELNSYSVGHVPGSRSRCRAAPMTLALSSMSVMPTHSSGLCASSRIPGP